MATVATSYPVGSLVRVRERDWVVIPSSDPDVLVLQPLTGDDQEAVGIYLPLEAEGIEPATFPWPDPAQAGDFVAGALVRDAFRLHFRSGAGPFRSMGRLSVQPRPYQVVPLIMALRLDPVRLLVADDVGVGKTIEAGLIARELLDRGEARRLAVLCPPYLCAQWQQELAEKFHIEAPIVHTSTLARLERELPHGDLSVYQYFPHLVISIDFVKSDRHRWGFLTHCPDLVIVDEAHGASRPGGARMRAQQQRYELVREVAQDPSRHLLLLTATPHSGVEEGFRSLLGLVKPDFEAYDIHALSEQQRQLLARHFVQRRRADVAKWLGEGTPFPRRVAHEVTYHLSAAYRKLFDQVWQFARETVRVPGLPAPRQRVRYWAALSLLRSVMSSPAAAMAALAARMEPAAATDEAGAVTAAEDESAQEQAVMDGLAESEPIDVAPTAAVEAAAQEYREDERRRLASFAEQVQALMGGAQDVKLARALDVLRQLLVAGHRPIVFCRFVPTVHYVAEHIRSRLGPELPGLEVAAITGVDYPEEERRDEVERLQRYDRCVLVATDCLSEGINLEEHFDAVVHYDLPWNPNRLEQREGRVDRFGQKRPEVHAVLIYGADNPIDGTVLRVLLQKAREIREALGVSVPVPEDSETVMNAVLRALFSDDPGSIQQLELALHQSWDASARREKESRTRFAQHAIRPEEVARELAVTDAVLGEPAAVERFVVRAAERFNLLLRKVEGVYELDPGLCPPWLRTRLGWDKPVRLAFQSPTPEGAVFVGRHHPLVEALCDHVVGEAFGPRPAPFVARSGAAVSAAVSRRTVLLLLRIRYEMRTRKGPVLFAEELVTAGFRRQGQILEWMEPNDPELLKLLEGGPSGSISDAERQRQVTWALETVREPGSELERIAERRAQELEEAHGRVRALVGGGGVRVRPYPPDVVACYVLVPGGNAP